MSDAELRGIADEWWEAQMVASPVYATFVGDHRFDDQMDELSEEAEADFLAMASAIGAKAEAIDPGSLAASGRVTRGLLLQAVEDLRTRVDLRLAELASD